MRRATDLRLLPLALATWATAFLAVTWPADRLVRLGVMIVIGGLVLAVTSAYVRPRRRSGQEASARERAAEAWPRAGPAWTLALVALGCGGLLLATAGHHHVRGQVVLAQLAEAGRTVQIEAVVTTDPRPIPASPGWSGDERHRVALEIRELKVRGQAHRLRAPVVALGEGAWAELRVGEPVRSTGRLVATDSGDAAVALFIAGDEPEILGEAPWYHRHAHLMRSGLVEAVADLSGQARGLVPGIAVGDDSALPDDLDEAMLTVSLTHITAVSGAHVVIVLGTVLAILSGAPPWLRALVGVLVLLGFVVLVRPEPSVLRAATTGGVGLLAMLLRRPSRAMPALCTAVVLLLLADPWLARSYGFVLSVLATGGLVLLAGPWSEALARVLPMPVAQLLAVPAAAQICCAPVIILLTPAISTYAVPANALAAPAVPPATVLGVLAALLAPVWPPGAEALAAGAAFFTAWIAGVARATAGLPGAALPWLEGVAGLLALAVLSVVVAGGVALALRLRTTGARSAHAWLVPGGGALVVVALVLHAAGGGTATIPRQWSAVVCDVGQGAMFVMRSGERSAVVVDVGPPGAGAGECLRRLGVERIDLLVLSHFHADHVGGLSEVIEVSGIERAIVSPHQAPSHAAVEVYARLAEAGVDVDAPVAGAGGEAGHLQWEVLWPTSRAIELVRPGDDGAANDMSLAVSLRAAGIHVVGLGDLEPDGQRGLLRQLRNSEAADGPGSALVDHVPVDHVPVDQLPIDHVPAHQLPVDIVLVAHHGSARQDAELAEHLAARLALIGVGADNSHGHPAPSTIAMYERAGAVLFSTDVCGDIAVTVEHAAAGAAEPAMAVHGRCAGSGD